MIRYGQIEERQVKRYENYGRNPSWKFKRYGKKQKKPKLNSEKIWKIKKKIVK